MSIRSTQFQSGFTLLELMVSVSIFAIIASLTISNLKHGNQKDDLEQSALLTASLLQQAQAYALSGQTLPSRQVPSGGYGLHFDSQQAGQLWFFADVDADGIYTGSDILFNKGEYDLPSQVKVQSLTIIEGAQSQTVPAVDFTFRPPQANRYLNGVLNGGTLRIVFVHQQTGDTKTVIASTASGQINVQ